jgi:hypothetical protein
VPFALRPATQDDEDFAWQIFKLTMQESIAAVWGRWDDVRWNTFFRRHYDPSLTRIIVVDGHDVGILRVLCGMYGPRITIASRGLYLSRERHTEPVLWGRVPGCLPVCPDA